MRVRFYDSGGVERLAIATGYDGKDEVHREATAEDRRRFRSEYEAFRFVVKTETAGEIDATPAKASTKKR